MTRASSAPVRFDETTTDDADAAKLSSTVWR